MCNIHEAVVAHVLLIVVLAPRTHFLRTRMKQVVPSRFGGILRRVTCIKLGCVLHERVGRSFEEVAIHGELVVLAWGNASGEGTRGRSGKGEIWTKGGRVEGWKVEG
jgi:hypothetical protein